LNKQLIWLVLILLLVGATIAGFGGFIWRHNRPLPEKEQVENYFTKEISALENLATQIDPAKLSTEKAALPDLDQVTGITPVIPSMTPIHEIIGRVKEVEEQLSDSELLTAEISFKSPESSSSIVVLYDESLNIWSTDLASKPAKESKLSYCYSGLRQLVKYETTTSSTSEQKVSFKIVFSPEVFQTRE